MRVFPKFITRVPVEVRGGRLYALGVPVWLDPPCRLSNAVYLKIDEAVHAKVAASGSNMPVGLDPRVWLHRCRCCKAPFIGQSEARLCSDACRAAAKRDSVRRASAKRSQRRYEVRNALTSVCRHCGKRQTALRSSKRFCSVTCRVAAHRGAPATFRAETPDTHETPATIWASWAASTTAALDRQIADVQQVLGTLKIVGTNDPAFMQGLAERVLALQAERAKLTAPAE
jgi:hypothetical protein